MYVHTYTFTYTCTYTYTYAADAHLYNEQRRPRRRLCGIIDCAGGDRSATVGINSVSSCMRDVRPLCVCTWVEKSQLSVTR